MTSIRDKILKSEVGSEIVAIPEWDVKIEVRQRTVRQQYDLINKVSSKDGDIDGMELAVETILVCSYDPDTGELVFDPSDKDAISNLEASSFQILLAAANRASGLESEDEVTSRLKGTSPDATSTT